MLTDGTADHSMSSGQGVWLAQPGRTEVHEEDLRRGLVGITRYLGQIRVTLLEHLALCVLIAEDLAVHESMRPQIRALVAAHDLHEVYVGDLMPGLKRLVPGLRAVEAAWEKHVHVALVLPAARPARGAG